MPKAEVLPNTDGLEIVSVGTLYDGPWDKKYWSSSRGKDRYPYPVGYHALRTHNGVTYKMEIHEGSAGPVFKITSSDGHSVSGQTPDIAWEAFQRKTSRIKLWHTKRFTCKVDGVEFFGFKNTLVQRLLRELLTSLDGASEQSLPSINVGNGSLAKEGDIPFADLSRYPDLPSYVTKSRITGKRSKKSKAANMNSAPQLTEQASSREFPKKGKDENLALLSSLREEYVICNGAQDLLSSVNLNCHENCPAPATGLCKSYQSSSDCEDKCYLAQMERQHLEVISYLQSTPENNAHIEETLDVLNPDKLKSIEVKNINPSVPSEHKGEESEIVNDSEVLEDSEISKNSLLYASDTLDTQQEDTSSLNITSTREPCRKKGEFGAVNTVTCSKPDGESCPEGDSCPQEERNTDTAYKSDFDSVAKEVAQTMLKVLLPQALPLLTYSSRRKKRKHSPLKESFITPRTHHEHDQILPSVDVASSGCDNLTELGPGELDGSSNFDRQKEDHMQNNCLGPAVQSTEEGNLGKHKSSTDKWQMVYTINSIMESDTCQNLMDLEKKTETHIPTEYLVSATSSTEKPTVHECIQNLQSEADVANQMQQLSYGSHVVAGNSLADKSLEDHTAMLASVVDCTCNGREVQKSMNNCLHLDDTSRIKSQFRKGESGASSSAGRIQHNTLGLVNSWRMPGEDHCIRTGTYGPGNSKSCQNSSVNLCKRTYNGPLSESIICRNLDGSLVQEEASSFGNENNDAIATAATSPRRQLYDLLDEKMYGDETSHKLECNAQVIGCYSHPKRISDVMLKLEADAIYVCTSCGLLEENGRDLFLYKLRIKNPSLGRPSFIGHSRIILPILQDVYGRDVPIEKSALQFTPDARGLVMLDIVQVPYCKARKFPCPCSTCASIRFEENAVKIVQVKMGHVSLLVKFKALYPVNSVLVCEPDCLVALDESGRIYLWFMNPMWSASTGDYVIPSYDFVASRVVELKRIPNSATLLLGHNGCGDFSLWDVTRRTILSRFSAPASSILGFLPISLFRWQNGQVHRKNGMECKDELMAAATTCLTEFIGERTLTPGEGEDIGIWILACTFSDSNCQPGCQPSNCQNSPGSWRLGLLVKNMVILGTSFPRSSAIGVSAGGHGIIGTDEGLAYMWDFKAGNKVEILQNFKGIGVSHIATDDSTQSATAVGGESGQLWIYLHG